MCQYFAHTGVFFSDNLKATEIFVAVDKVAVGDWFINGVVTLAPGKSLACIYTMVIPELSRRVQRAFLKKTSALRPLGILLTIMSALAYCVESSRTILLQEKDI